MITESPHYPDGIPIITGDIVMIGDNPPLRYWGPLGKEGRVIEERITKENGEYMPNVQWPDMSYYEYSCNLKLIRRAE